MSQLKKLKKQIPFSHPDAIRQIYNNPESSDGGLTKALDPVTRQNLTEQAEMALNALKQGKKVQVLIPLCIAEKIRPDWLYVLGHEHIASATLYNRKPAESVASLAKLLKETGFVCFADENGLPYSKATNVVEKVVEKEVKTTTRDLIRAIDNTSHQMSKTFQKDTVEAILNEFRKQVKI
jgi:hypothetical protein